jgi:hypothetical protein
VEDDVQINSRVRRAVSANWFDITLLRIRTTRGVISIQGRIHKLSEKKDERDGDPSSLKKLHDDLRALRGVRGVNYHLDNWRREPSGNWHCTERKPVKKPHESKSG